MHIVDTPSKVEPQDETGDYKDFWDKAGHKYSVLIRRTADYIVYISEETNRIDWATSNAYDLECEKATHYAYDKKCRVLAVAALLEARPCSDLPDDVQRDFRILIGEALVSCFEHDYETAGRLISEAEQYINARSQEQSRYWYVISCLWSIAPFAVVVIIFWCLRLYFQQTLGLSVFWLVLAVCAGALGGLFSVLLRTGKINFDSASGRKVHNLEGVARVLTGAIAGGVVALAIRSELLFPSLARGDKSEFVLLFLAMVAGSGERLASSMIEKFDSNYREKN
ncbi:hypothetical protein [Kerstersia sp.]|uniref:hypothetical protein n=1 Tax=Kerstersia sp. TaxID=1930783 RepID=UPI003F90BC88